MNWIILVVVGLAFGARLVGIGWGLPYLYHFDEPNNLIRTLTMLQEGDPNPHWFHYGSLMFYLYGGLIAIVTGVRALLGVGGGLETIEGPQMIATASGLTAEPWTLMVPRITSVFLSAMTVVVIYFIVKRLTGRMWAAGFGAVLFALAPLGISEGRLFTPNTLTALFTALAMGAAFRIFDRGLLRDYVIAGVMVGLAAGSKYSAGFVVVVVVAAHSLRGRQVSDVHLRDVLMSIYAALATFLITTPFAVLDSDSFLGDLGFELAHYATGHVGQSREPLVYLAVLALTFSTALGLIPFAIRDRGFRPFAMIALLYAAGYVGFLSWFQTTFERNILPALPAICVVIGLGAATGLGRRSPARSFRTMLITTVSISVAVAGSAVWIDYANLEDRRDAVNWLAESIPAGSLVYVEAYSPWVDRAELDVMSLEFAAGADSSRDWDYFLITPRGSGRFELRPDLYATEVAVLGEIRSSSCLIREFPGVVEVWAQVC